VQLLVELVVPVVFRDLVDVPGGQLQLVVVVCVVDRLVVFSCPTLNKDSSVFVDVVF